MLSLLLATLLLPPISPAPGDMAWFAPRQDVQPTQPQTADAAQSEKDSMQGEPISHNPYYQRTAWRVWRDDPTPIENVDSMVREDKQEKSVQITLAPIDFDARSYPSTPPQIGSEAPYATFAPGAKPSAKHAGMWDDVYSSWSGLHGYVRPHWRGADGSKVNVLGQILHFVDGDKSDMLRVGVNFIHQSTTGMAHTITNGYGIPMTTSYEELYFADCLVTSPAHSSYTDLLADRSSDLYIAHVPTLFNSVGSSNSETMAITKMMIAGAYLPPETKLLLKRNGLYPATMLYLWKASLPYDVPYDHELRHRIAYKSVGNRATYPEKYSAAGINKGDQALAFHQYDDFTHMRNMIDLASSMDIAPPEAVFDVKNTGGGTLRYALKKAAVIVQEQGEDVELQVSTAGCYDLQNLPLNTRWKLLYGNKRTTVEQDPQDPTQYTIRVPWDEALPEGRTAIALVASNGRFESNPAILTVYRNKSEIPPHGGGPQDYKFPLTWSNRRPLLLDFQDQVVKPGKELRIPLHSIDPEGFPITYYKRAGEIGEIDGNVFVWKCPRKAEEGPRTVTLIASDGTSGNSYAGRQITIHVGAPQLMAHIKADKLSGPAPLKVKFSAKDSVGRKSKTKFTWDFRAAKDAGAKKTTADLEAGRDLVHTFSEAGLYTVELTMTAADASTDTEIVHIWVSENEAKPTPGALNVEGNCVLLRKGDTDPSPFDHSWFGELALGESQQRDFRLTNSGEGSISFASRRMVKLEGPHASDFKITQMPRKKLDGGDSSRLSIVFKGQKKGLRTATVIVGSGLHQTSFAIGAEVL
jgi:hypothetical protein